MLIVQYKNDKWASAQREFNLRICFWAAKRAKLIPRKYQRLQYNHQICTEQCIFVLFNFSFVCLLAHHHQCRTWIPQELHITLQTFPHSSIFTRHNKITNPALNFLFFCQSFWSSSTESVEHHPTTYIREIKSTPLFKQHLQTHLFAYSY